MELINKQTYISGMPPVFLDQEYSVTSISRANTNLDGC